MRVELHPEARAELADATFWYEERRVGLGDEFVTAILHIFKQLSEAPALFPPWPDMSMRVPIIRRAVTPRFPFVVAFEVHEQHVLVLAIAHSKRRPLYWLERAY